MRKYSQPLLCLFLFGFLLLLILRPGPSAQGAAYGLSLWYQVVLPSLLPFLILSSLMQVYQKNLASRPAQIVFLGFLCGYPVGAKMLADVSRPGQGSRLESPVAAWLLSFCNQASPMFLFSYLPQMLGSTPGIRLLLVIGVYGSALFAALISAFFCRPWQCASKAPVKSAPDVPVKLPAAPVSDSFIQVLEQTMLRSLEIMVKIGGYMMLFSIAAYHLMDLPFGSVGLKSLILSLNEMTTGIAFVSASALPFRMKSALAIASAAFGGFSGLAQTGCVLQGSALSTRSYLGWKLFQGAVAFLLVYGLLQK